EIEIDLWQPDALIAALHQQGLTGWVHFANAPPSSDSGIAAWLSYTAFVPVLVATYWLLATVGRIQKQRITIGWAHTGIGLAIVLIGIGTLAFVIVVGELAG